jgi:predicted RNA binding protein YcfA (HicA-like mRNA interferase family)
VLGETIFEKRRQIYNELKSNPKSIKYRKFVKILDIFGFKIKPGRGKGSHSIYYREDIDEIVNIQDKNGMAKPYQVKQLVRLIEKYDLTNRP